MRNVDQAVHEHGYGEQHDPIATIATKMSQQMQGDAGEVSRREWWNG